MATHKLIKYIILFYSFGLFENCLVYAKAYINSLFIKYSLLFQEVKII